MSGPDTPDTSDSLIRQLARAPRRELEDLETASISGPDAGVRSGAPLPEVGDVLDGRYQLESILGSGGMGIVFAARNLRTEKKVALKYLTIPQRDRTRSSERRAARFLREARAAGRVRHPNVVDMIDVGGDPARPYLVMELLRGQSLYARMLQGPLPFEDAISILLCSMHGVAEAHRQGVIHRDIKPENIFLAETVDTHEPGRKTSMTPKVLDFGVSRITESSTDERPTTLTQAGNVIGTPSYMPLEQLRGKTDVDARADVYSLGVVLYEALSGRRPFEAHNAHDLAIKMATETPARLVLHGGSQADPRLEHVVMRALARVPEDRYPSVEAFAQALSGYQHAMNPRWRHMFLAAALVASGALVWWLGADRWAAERKAESNPRTPAITEVARQERVPSVARAADQEAAPAVPTSVSNPSSAAVPTPAELAAPEARPRAARMTSKRLSLAPKTEEAAAASAPSAAPAPIERAKTLLPNDF
ncbi:MAG: serine/threonine-protein kinase [Myxococcales bacterium]